VARQVVAEFFAHTSSPEQARARDLRETYRQRRKDARKVRGNNW